MAASTYPLHGGQGQITVGGQVVGSFQNFSMSGVAAVNTAKVCRSTEPVVGSDGVQEITVQFDGLFDNGDAGQALLVPGTTVALVFEPDNNGTGADQATASVVLSGIEHGFPRDGFATFSASGTVNGEVTWSTVS